MNEHEIVVVVKTFFINIFIYTTFLKLINKKMLGRVFSKVISQDIYDEIGRQLLGSEKD